MNEKKTMTRREAIAWTGRFTAAITCGVVLGVPTNAKAMDPISMTLIISLAIAALEKLAQPDSALGKTLTSVENQMSKFLTPDRAYYSIGAKTKGDIDALQAIQYQQIDLEYAWQQWDTLHQISGDRKNAPNNLDNLWVSLTYKNVTNYEPFMPYGAARPFRWKTKEDAMDLLVPYRSYMQAELTPAQNRDLKEFVPIYYRWVYGGAGNPFSLSVAYEERGPDKKQFLWLYNRPGADLKRRQGLFDICLDSRKANLVQHPGVDDKFLT